MCLLWQIFFDYCEKAYKEFMEGADTFEALDEELAKQFGKCIPHVAQSVVDATHSSTAAGH